VTCDVGTLAPGDTTTVDILVWAKQPGTQVNRATVSSETRDPDTSNNRSRAVTVVILASADLSIEKQAPTEVTDGQAFDYTLTVTNDGPSDAQGVVVEDNHPDGVSYNDGASTDSCELISSTPDPNDVRCTLADPLPVNEQATFTINVTATQPGEQVNRATVSSDTADPDEGNNRSVEVTTTVAALADLAIDKEAPAEVADEDRFVYRIEVTNDGPSDADAVRVTDELPEGVRFASAPGGCTNDAGTVRCDFATMASGETVVVTIRVRAKSPGELRNTATVESSTSDPNEQNNGDTTATVVWPQPDPTADLSIEKSARPEPTTVGEKLVYNLTVTNNGPDAATGVIIRDPLPQEVAFVSASEDCEKVRGTVTCSVGRMADGASVTRKIVVRVEHSGELHNTATVRSEATDPGPVSNADTESTTARSYPKPLLPTACGATPSSGNVIKGTRGKDVLRGTLATILSSASAATTPSTAAAATIPSGARTRTPSTVAPVGTRYTARVGATRWMCRMARGDLASGGAGTDTCSFDRGDRVTSCL
jgi:uncharacterized repeat protein (TIGR01451 family)